jgi:hypothetical protein
LLLDNVLPFSIPRYIKGLFILLDPPPPKDSVDDADLIPEATAGLFSLLTFQWMAAIMALGYARPLEAPDLYRLQDYRSAGVIADKLVKSFDARLERASEYNSRLANGEIEPSIRQRIWWTLRGDRQGREERWREKDGKKKASLALAMNDSIKWWFWSAGVCKVTADTAQVTSPLIVKVGSFACNHHRPWLTSARAVAN